MIFQPDWAPNLHPLLVHFPIGLLIAALGTDLCTWLLPRAGWAAPTTAFLYPAGALSALATYLTGRQAAATVLLPGMAHPIVRDHWNWALATTICFLTVAVLRVAVTLEWPVRFPPWVRPALTIVALVGIALLFHTGELGARLVYEQGVGVRAPATRR